MPIEFKSIYRNDSLKEQFSDSIENNRLPHAFILEGAEGSGKESFAFDIASASLCTSDLNKPCGICKNCRQIREGVSPDVTVISLPEDKATISVDAVRFIKSDALTYPVEGELKFYIIKDSERLTVQAQNALLKILEEPPSFVVFILLCESAGALLTTVRSRAPLFRMQRFTEDELREYALEASRDAQKLMDSDPIAFSRVIKSSGGSIGQLNDSLTKRVLGRTAKENEFITELISTLGGKDKAIYMKHEDGLCAKRDEFRAQLCRIRCAVRDLLVFKKDNSAQLLFFESEDTARQLSKSFTADSLLRMLDITDEMISANELNGNLNLLKINYICALWKCAH